MKDLQHEFEAHEKLVQQHQGFKDPFYFFTDMWHNETSYANVKNFIKEHYGTLARFLFHYQGSTIRMHWKEDIYEYFKEYKHSQNNNGMDQRRFLPKYLVRNMKMNKQFMMK
jgi:hypothetical protein